MKAITVEYKLNGGWTYIITNHNSGLRVFGDQYSPSKKGLREAKRDSQDIIKHLRKNNQIIVKR